MQTVPTIREQIDALLDELTPQQLERALGSIQTIKNGRPPGIKPKELIEFFHQFPAPSDEEAEEMIRIIGEIEKEGKVQPGNE